MSDKNSFRKAELRLSTPVRLGVAAVAACFIAGPALSNPVNPTVVNGTATFNQAGNVLTVTNSNGAIINWQQFNIGAGETTHFAQASASSTVLNRVLAGGGLSAIYGTLSSNGRVWLVNPAGIMVGPGGQVNVAGFVASTLSVRNEDFLAGRHLFVNDGTAQNVVNQGEINTPSGGSVYLIGANVSNESVAGVANTGIITTPNGETILAAGQTVSLIDSALPGVKVEITGAAGNVTNLGTITAEAGRIGIAGVIVRNSGTLNASSVVSDGGRIFLKATDDTLVDGGRLAATSVGGKGGQVDVLGDRVAVMNNSEIDVSGATGGGYIRVGGDYQGKNPGIQNASITYFGPDARLKADATGVGAGGTVIVWADDTTRAYGSISARGGAYGGNGGFIETSGKRYLDVAGIGVSTAAPDGVTGTWLLDPTDITIVHSGTPGGATFPANIFANGGGTSATLNDYDISSNLASNSIIITTSSAGGGTGDITFDASAGAGGAILITNGSGAARALSLVADNDIKFAGGATSFQSTAAASPLAVNLSPAVGHKVDIATGATLAFNGYDAGSAVAGVILNMGPGARTWENQGIINLSGESYIDLHDGTYYSAFNNNAGGVVNITSSAGWSLLSENATQDGALTNAGTINVNGTAGGSSNYSAWEVKYNQAAGGVLNIGAGKKLSMQNPDTIAGSVVLGLDGILALSERHANPTPSFSGATLTGPGIVDIKNLGYDLTGATLGGGVVLANSAGNLSVPVSGVSYSGNVGFMASGDLTVSAGVSTAGNVLLVAGWDGASPQSLPITSNPGGDIQVTDATVNGAAIKMYAGGNIALTATTASAAVVGSGAMLVKAGGVLSLLGSTTGSFSANLNSNAGSQTIDAGSISLVGGSGGNWSYAQINADGDQQITTTAGGITLMGGSGAYYGNFAQIRHGATSGNQTINVFGGTVALTGGSASGTTVNTLLLPAVCAADPGCASQAVTGAWAGITNSAGSQTLAFQNAGGVLNVTGGSNGIRNAAWISQGGTGAQTISGAPMVTLAGGASGGSNFQSTDGFHYLRNNASIFSPLGAQSLTLASLGLTSVATNAAGFGGAWITGKGQTISMAGALSLMAGDTNAGGGSVGIRSLAGQTIGAGGVTLQAGGVGYDNTASIDQVGTGAYSQSLTATSLTLQGGSGNGAGNSAGDCGVACNGSAAHNSAGVYNSGGGGQTVNVAGGAINLIAGTVGNGNKAYIQNRAAGLQTVNAAGIFLQGGNSGGMSSFGQTNVWGGSWLSNTASITSGWSGGVIGSQNIASTGAILLAGNSGPGSSGMGGAGIAATGSQTVSGVAISLVGGAGSASESSARIGSLGAQSITASSLALQAGATGIGNRASVSGYGQTISVSGGVLSVVGGGTTASDHSNAAEIVNYGGSGQSIVFSTAATMTVQGGLGSGNNLFGWSDCGAPCNNLSSWNAAEVRNESGFQAINFQGGGALNMTAGSNGNDSYARIRNRSTGVQQILGAPAITLARGTSGGTTVWAPSLVEHPGVNVWHEMGNDAGIEADAGQTISASSITMNTGAGGGFGGLFITGHTQNITVTGALTMGGAPGGDAVNAPIGTPYGNATEFQFKAPAIIGDDSLGHSLNLSVGSLVMNGGGYGIYGGSPTLIGTYKHATNTSITSAGAISVSTAAGGVQIGSFFGNGGVLSMTAGGAGMALDGALVGTGSSGASGSVALITGNGPFSQAAGGRIVGRDVSIATGTGDITQPVGAVIDALNLNASGNNLSFLGDNLATNAMLASTGAGGGIGYKTAVDTHIVFATAASGNIDINSTGVPTVSIGLGTVTASTGGVTIAAERAILDDNGSALNITANFISLTSIGGGVSGSLAISADTATTGNIVGGVTGGSSGGIYIRNLGGTPSSVILSDSASANASVHFHNNASFSTSGSSLTTVNGGTARFSGGGDLTWDGGTFSVGGTGNIGLTAAGTLGITAALNGGNDHITLAGGTIDINNWIATTGDLAMGAGVIYINDAVSAQNVVLGAGTLNIGNVGGSGGIHAGNHLLAVVTGNVNITGGGGGGYIKTTSGDLEMLAGGDLNINDGGYIWAGYTQMSPPYADVSIAVGGDIRLNNGSHINAANDVFLDLLGPTSTLYLNDAQGYANPSYVLSSIGGVPPTTHVSFLTRNSGGIVIDGEDTAETAVGSSGFFTVDTSTPALPGAGLEITYAQNNTGVLALLANILGRAVDDVDPTTTPTDDDGPKKLGARDDKGDKGDKDGGFGGDEEDKDKKKSDDGKDGKKDDKPTKKQVAQCS